MGMGKNNMVHEVLKSLCLDNGWCYGVLWSFDHQNSMLLTMEDAYCEDQVATFIDNMLLQVHIVGNGIVGNTALSKKHQWVFAENHPRDVNLLSSTGIHEISQDDSEIYSQFSYGIETIVIVSVEPHGVVQFGSTRKALETIQFVDRTKTLFRSINSFNEFTLPEYIPSASNEDLHSLNNSLFFPSTSYSFSGKIDITNNANSDNCMGTSCSSTDIDNSYPFTLNIENQLNTTTTESPFLFTNELLTDFPSSFLSTPLQSSLTNTFDPENIIENNIFDNFGVDFEFGDIGNIFADISAPSINRSKLDFTKEVSECISGQRDNSVFTPRESLFSRLGIDQYLNGMTSVPHSIAETSSNSKLSSGTKRKRDFFVDSQSCGNSYVLQPKLSEESIKHVKKRAKPGSRPKPKDRQQIQDRIAELRKLIPNGIKMSIDSLLAQTIKHMVFLESATKHAENIKKVEAQKDIAYNTGWTFESQIHPILDPVIVKDLSLPGQKQIQILCEQKGFFLEIVDIIQDLGLSILKGKMEVRDDKLWARFIVESEAKKYITKQDIYLSLHQLLYQNGSKISVCDKLANESGGSNLFNNYHQNMFQFPVDFSNGLV